MPQRGGTEDKSQASATKKFVRTCKGESTVMTKTLWKQSPLKRPGTTGTFLHSTEDDSFQNEVHQKANEHTRQSLLCQLLQTTLYNSTISVLLSGSNIRLVNKSLQLENQKRLKRKRGNKALFGTALHFPEKHPKIFLQCKYLKQKAK